MKLTADRPLRQSRESRPQDHGARSRIRADPGRPDLDREDQLSNALPG
jgi:hypothetical protein